MPSRFRHHDPHGADLQPTAAQPGVSSLLDSIDSQERALHENPAGSTAGAGAFAQVLDDLTANLASDLPVLPSRLRRRPTAPRPLSAPGDLVAVIGASTDAVAVARSMAAASGGADVVVAGSVHGTDLARIDDRRTAVRARAVGVMKGTAVFVALGLDLRRSAQADWETTMSAVCPDQVWVAVDAGRKPEDTASWVQAVASRVPVDAIAVEGSDATATPHTVHDLGVLVGWVDGAPAMQQQPTSTVWDS